MVMYDMIFVELPPTIKPLISVEAAVVLSAEVVLSPKSVASPVDAIVT